MGQHDSGVSNPTVIRPKFSSNTYKQGAEVEKGAVSHGKMQLSKKQRYLKVTNLLRALTVLMSLSTSYCNCFLSLVIALVSNSNFCKYKHRWVCETVLYTSSDTPHLQVYHNGSEQYQSFPAGGQSGGLRLYHNTYSQNNRTQIAPHYVGLSTR